MGLQQRRDMSRFDIWRVEGTPCSRGPVRVTATRATETHLRAGAGAGPPEARSRHETRSRALWRLSRSVPFSFWILPQMLHVINRRMKLITVCLSFPWAFGSMPEKNSFRSSLLNHRTFLEFIASKMFSALKGRFSSEPGKERNLGEWFPWYLPQLPW